ncbi:MAG: hypothetical protein GY875_08890 [Gammaproteobacteria bacterium]|nr:hypothetical protein [Gammaproteobacteria bacterium]
MLVAFEKITRAVFVVSLMVSGYLYVVKDALPETSFYDVDQLRDPIQSVTRENSFTTQANDQQYVITPLYDYELDGVIVSLHDSDDFLDITHHRRWQDYINLRDLCVIWGDNVRSGVYHEMEFTNGTWTCWFSWPNSEVASRFDDTQLSNNHLLIDDDAIKQALMQAEAGDHIRLKGMLVEYSNPGNGFQRGTSVTRTDTGNGACETIYVNAFEVIKKANRGTRHIYTVAFWITALSLVGVLVLFFITPYRGARG